MNNEREDSKIAKMKKIQKSSKKQLLSLVLVGLLLQKLNAAASSWSLLLNRQGIVFYEKAVRNEPI